MVRVYPMIKRHLRVALPIASLAALLATAPAFAASTLPKAGEPVGTADLGWIAGAAVLIIVVGVIVRRRQAGR
jgi:ABC-type proline/glycine betaine transport system substrate-binding protein